MALIHLQLMATITTKSFVHCHFNIYSHHFISTEFVVFYFRHFDVLMIYVRKYLLNQLMRIGHFFRVAIKSTDTPTRTHTSATQTQENHRAREINHYIYIPLLPVLLHHLPFNKSFAAYLEAVVHLPAFVCFFFCLFCFLFFCYLKRCLLSLSCFFLSAFDAATWPNYRSSTSEYQHQCLKHHKLYTQTQFT